MKRLLIALLVILTVFQAGAVNVQAANSDSTSYTVIMNNDGNMQIVQDAYLPTSAYTDLGLNRPSDIFILGDYMYIADTGNRRALRVHLYDGTRDIFGEGLLRQPTGIAADEEGRVYIADSGNTEAYRFSSDLKLEQAFVRPDSPRFGANAQFRPTKVAPANNGGVYLVNEGSVAGLVHMDGGGAFLGYYGSTDVYMSAFDRLLDIILTEAQKSRFLRRSPPSFANIDRASDGLIYSVNRGIGVTVNKHNIGGLNILVNEQAPEINDAVDLTVTDRGEIYILDSNGYITEMTPDGYLVNIFGGPSEGFDRAGLFNIPTGIASDTEGRVYVIDQSKDYVQIFAPTQGQAQLHEAIHAYSRGDYDTSTALLTEVVRINNTSRLAHTYLGKNHMQATEFEEAAAHFRTARQISDYSEAYWEIRNNWLQENLLLLLLAVAVGIGLMLYSKSVKKKRNAARTEGSYTPTRWERFTERNRLAYDFSQIKYAMTHPTDHAYEISVGRTGSWLSGSLILLLFFVIFVILQVGSGFIFSVVAVFLSIGAFAIFFAAVVFLFVAGNYLIVAIRDGKGTLRSIFLITVYSLSPAIILLPLAILIGNVATLNESFFYGLIISLAIIWCIVALFNAIMQIHEYSFAQAIGNVLLTLFAMIVVVIVVSLLYLVVRQLIYMIQEMYLEVILRA